MGFFFFFPLLFRFNYEIKPLPLQAEGQILQLNQAYTCSNTFQGRGDEGYFRASRVISGPVSSRNVRPPDYPASSVIAPVIDQGSCAHDITANLVSIIDQEEQPHPRR